jgi:hypothetical protein
MRLVILAILATLAGCGGNAPPAADARQPPVDPPPSPSASRILQISFSEIRGGEGPHSASHSGWSQSGQLEIRGNGARLELAQTSHRSYVVCPEGRDDLMANSRQACHRTPPPPHTPVTHAYEMRGTHAATQIGFRLELTFVDRTGATRRTLVSCQEGTRDDSFEYGCQLDEAWPNPVEHGFHRPTLHFGQR